MIARLPPDLAYFGGAKIPAPAPMPDFKIPDFPAIEFPAIEFPAPYDPEAASEKQRRAKEQQDLRAIEQKRKGYGSTLITGGQGVETPATTNRPSLLGS
jgi:hypothetical protein